MWELFRDIGLYGDYTWLIYIYIRVVGLWGLGSITAISMGISEGICASFCSVAGPLQLAVAIGRTSWFRGLGFRDNKVFC